MGMANYYLKARFPSDNAARAALPRIAAFIKEGQAAEPWCQDHRHVVAEQFWPDFDATFPAVTEYFKAAQCHGGHTEALAGVLNFGTDEEPSISCGDPGVVLFSAYVWHFAQWEPFCDFLKSEYGATDTDWTSDEYADPYECLSV